MFWKNLLKATIFFVNITLHGFSVQPFLWSHTTQSGTTRAVCMCLFINIHILVSVYENREDLLQETVSQIVIGKITHIKCSHNSRYIVWLCSKMKGSTTVRRKLTSQTWFSFCRKWHLQMGLLIIRRKGIHNIKKIFNAKHNTRVDRVPSYGFTIINILPFLFITFPSPFPAGALESKPLFPVVPACDYGLTGQRHCWAAVELMHGGEGVGVATGLALLLQAGSPSGVALLKLVSLEKTRGWGKIIYFNSISGCFCVCFF